MPIYGGGKASIGREIWLAIKEKLGQKGESLDVVEPFCGLLGVTRWIEPEHKVRAYDKNASLVMALNAIRAGWEPPCQPPNRDEYERIKREENSP